MSIFSRMSDIVNSNLNALLDGAENPEKMIRLIIQEMEDTVVEVRSSSAKVMGERNKLTRELARLEADVVSWEQKAALALEKDRDDLARAALHEKRSREGQLQAAGDELAAADEHIEHLGRETAQLEQKLVDAKAKQKALSVKAASPAARTVVKREASKVNLSHAVEKFERFERRMDNLEGELDAMALGEDVFTVEAKGLAHEIASLQSDEWVSAELARLKTTMVDNGQTESSRQS